MKHRFVMTLRNIYLGVWKVIGQFQIGRFVIDDLIRFNMERTMRVQHGKETFLFSCPNRLNQWRLNTFSTKEPETLDWIDHLEPESVLWDIGANVGLYSVYAARTKGCRIYAFEPSIFNLELLARNIFVNNVSNKVSIVPLPLSQEVGINNLHMTTREWGGAISTFGSSAIGHDGLPLNKIFEFGTLGISMDFAVSQLGIKAPDYIKMDVDGIEHIILEGGKNTLKHVKGIIIEINDAFEEQRENSKRILTECGFELKSKQHGNMVDAMQGFEKTYNQIWIKHKGE